MITKVPDTHLPPAGSNGLDDHVQMSKRFQEHTAIEIGKRNRLQASEKIWASVAQMLKAIAKRRGCTNLSHTDLGYISAQLGRENDAEGEYAKYYLSVAQLHSNFYENGFGLVTIKGAREKAEEFIKLLHRDLERAPGPFTARDVDNRDRLNSLGRPDRKGLPRKMPKVKVGDSSPFGFAPKFAPRAPSAFSPKGSRPVADGDGESPIKSKQGAPKEHNSLPRQCDLDNPRRQIHPGSALATKPIV